MVDTNAQVLADQLLALPPRDRARMAQLLLASLDGADSDVEAAWEKEVASRASEMDSGRVRGIPAQEVFAEVERRLGV